MKKHLFNITLLIGLLSILSSAHANWQLELGVPGHALKKADEALELQLSSQADETANADIYLALQMPDQQLLFFTASAPFAGDVDFSFAPRPYATNVDGQSRSGRVLRIEQLPLGIPAGRYHVYALAVRAGADLLATERWLSPLAHGSFVFLDNRNNLPIPPEMTGTLNAQGQKVFDLHLQTGQKNFLPNTQTATFGINGDYLGPTIRLAKGDKALFNVHNMLGETTTIHWHGAHIPAKMDGGPHQVIAPDATWQPSFEIKQNAATIWYHPHLKGKTAEHVYKGLAGFFIIDDQASNALALPRQYGVDDIPVVVQDRRISENGDMSSQLRDMVDVMGLRGQYMLVNGALTPTLDTAAQVIRLRLLNGSNARIYNFGFADNRDFYQIATGGGLLEAPVMMKRLRLAPGERAEILLDLRQDSGQYLTLQSYSGEISATMIADPMMRDALDNQTFDIMTIRVGEAGDNGLGIPAQLVQLERLSEQAAALSRPFVLKENMGNMGGMNMAGMNNMNMGGSMTGMIGADNSQTFDNLSNMGMFTINDKVMDMNRIDETVRLGDTEIWVISNESEMAHPFHIHDIQFQILDRNGQAPSAGEAGWKDTVLVLPQETVRVITRFEDYADPDAPYMYHCHILEHEDAGMMGQFVVVP